MKLKPDFWKKKKEDKCFLCGSPLGENSGQIVRAADDYGLYQPLPVRSYPR